MKPSELNPSNNWSSVTMNSECETVMRNILIILKRTGDTFRELTYKEYEKERLKDGYYSKIEESFFNHVIGYVSEEKIQTFAQGYDLNKVFFDEKRKPINGNKYNYYK